MKTTEFFVQIQAVDGKEWTDLDSSCTEIRSKKLLSMYKKKIPARNLRLIRREEKVIA